MALLQQPRERLQSLQREADHFDVRARNAAQRLLLNFAALRHSVRRPFEDERLAEEAQP